MLYFKVHFYPYINKSKKPRDMQTRACSRTHKSHMHHFYLKQKCANQANFGFVLISLLSHTMNN